MTEILALLLAMCSPDYRHVTDDRYAVRIAAERNLGRHDALAFVAGQSLIRSRDCESHAVGLRLLRKVSARWPAADRVRYVWWFVFDPRPDGEMEAIGWRELGGDDGGGGGVDAAIHAALSARFPMRVRQFALYRTFEVEGGRVISLLGYGPDYDDEREWVRDPFGRYCRQLGVPGLPNYLPLLRRLP